MIRNILALIFFIICQISFSQKQAGFWTGTANKQVEFINESKPAEIHRLILPSLSAAPLVLTAGFVSSDTTVCWGSCISFSSTGTGTPTSWKWTFEGANPDTSTIANPVNICYPASGTFTVKLVVSDGTSSDSVVRSIYVVAPVIDAGTDATITAGASTTLNATGNTLTYTWSPSAGLSDPNIAGPSANPNVTTTYIVTGTDANNCTASDMVTIYVNDVACGEVFVPTAFSPNNDGENDTECIMGNCISVLDFSIYDRWGEKVFQTKEQTTCWDGYLRGKIMNSGVFVYRLTATLKNGEVIEKKGNISLIR